MFDLLELCIPRSFCAFRGEALGMHGSGRLGGRRAAIEDRGVRSGKSKELTRMIYS